MRKENNVDARQRNLTFQSRIVTPRPASNNSFCSPASTSVLALNRFTTGSGLPVPRRVTRKSFASERAASAVNETATNVSRIAHNRNTSSSNVTQALIGGCPFEWAQTQLSVRVRVAGRARFKWRRCLALTQGRPIPSARRNCRGVSVAHAASCNNLSSNCGPLERIPSEPVPVATIGSR